MSGRTTNGNSLRGRLWIAGALGVLSAALLSAWGLGALFERAALSAFDRQLVEDQLTLIGLIAADGDGAVRLRREPADDRYARVFSGYYWQIVHGSETLGSRSLWDAGLDLPPAMQPSSAEAVHFLPVTGPQEQRLRAAVRTVQHPGISGPVQVTVAGDVSSLHADVRRFRAAAAAGAGGIAALLLTVLVLQVGYGLRPLRGLASNLAEVRDGRRGRVDATNLPREVRPLAAHLNELLEFHEQAIRRARHAAGDLAHALKTPLAVLSAAAERSDADLPATVAAQVTRIRAAMDRHLAAGTPGSLQGRADVAATVEALMRLFGQAYAERGLNLQTDIAPGLAARCPPEDLEEMLGNVIDNACKWAKTGVIVRASFAPKRVLIEVEDDGPGIPPEARDEVLGRGVRLDERTDGSGLGLSIARELAEVYGGELALAGTAGDGLRVRLWLPRSTDGP